MTHVTTIEQTSADRWRCNCSCGWTSGAHLDRPDARRSAARHLGVMAIHENPTVYVMPSFNEEEKKALRELLAL